MIENCLRPAIQDNQEMWSQQDGATDHTARQSMALLRGLFGGHLISRFSGFNWSSRSPDLTAPEFFIWGYLKERVYVNNPRTIQELKNNIRHEIRELEPVILRSVMKSAITRAHLCEAENGGHLKDIIFKN